MIDILVISTSSFTSINREVYVRLYKKGWKVELVVPRSQSFPGGIRQAELQREYDPPIHFLNLKGKIQRFQYFEGIKSLLNKLKPKFIYLDNDPGSYMAYVPGKWAKSNNAQLICQTNENQSYFLSEVKKRQGIKGLPTGILKKLILSYNRKYVSHIFSINRDGEKIFREMGFQSVQMIPLGFDDDLFKPDKIVREQYRNKLNLNAITFAFFGRMIHGKGLHILLEALSSLKMFSWNLMLDDFAAYKGPYYSYIKDMIQSLDLSERVVYIHSSHSEMPAYMNAADVVILPSITTPTFKEQYGRVIPEAMACQKLVVTSNSGALPEVVADSGIVIEENNILLLAQTLKSILTEPEKYSLLPDKALKRAINHLSVGKQAEVIDGYLKK
jgi:glycosyltransferase involved in cell wall biosynthesis